MHQERFRHFVFQMMVAGARSNSQPEAEEKIAKLLSEALTEEGNRVYAQASEAYNKAHFSSRKVDRQYEQVVKTYCVAGAGCSEVQPLGGGYRVVGVTSSAWGQSVYLTIVYRCI